MKNALHKMGLLCRGEELERISEWSRAPADWARVALVIVAGAGMYGGVIGLWRAPLQAGFTFIKFPLLLLLTPLANALLNGMLAQLLGLPISFRQSSFAILCSFAVAALILAAFSPVAFFVLLNTPPLGASSNLSAYSVLLLTHVGVIAVAGVMGNLRLHGYLARAARSASTARKILFAWLAGNLFLGCQLSWILRPFVGAPTLPIQFFRPDAFHGNFYEAAWSAWMNLW